MKKNIASKSSKQAKQSELSILNFFGRNVDSKKKNGKLCVENCYSFTYLPDSQSDLGSKNSQKRTDEPNLDSTSVNSREYFIQTNSIELRKL